MIKSKNVKSKQNQAFFACLLFICLLISGSVKISARDGYKASIYYSSLITHDPISITSDSAFSVFPGSGTEEDPYLIENYNITTTSGDGVYITGTTKHFVIRNCYINAQGSGIYIYDVADRTVLVENNTCESSDDGIVIRYSQYALVYNNTCINITGDAIAFKYLSKHGIIVNNLCIDNGVGVYSDSDNVTVINNTCKNGLYGIELDLSYDSQVINNTLINNDNGVILRQALNAVVTNNTFFNDGISVVAYSKSDYLSYTIQDNKVNDKNLGYFCNINSLAIDEPIYGQLLFLYCDNLTVRNQVLHNTTRGIDLTYCDDGFIINNTCVDNHYQGITIDDSDNTVIANNTCKRNGDCGLKLRGNFIDYSAIYNILEENDEYGISIIADNSVIHHNAFIGNNPLGTSQANDDGENNLWYEVDKLEGNYWQDYSGSGDYAIDGVGNSIDPYPLLSTPIVDTIPPSISNIVHSPVYPTESDMIIINATIIDDTSVHSATLHYRINAGSWTEVSMNLVSTDIYSANIGPFLNSDVIDYYISAIDDSFNHNEDVNDNEGEFYSFAITLVIAEFRPFYPSLLTIIPLNLIVVLAFRKKRRNI